MEADSYGILAKSRTEQNFFCKPTNHLSFSRLLTGGPCSGGPSGQVKLGIKEPPVSTWDETRIHIGTM